MFSKEVALTSFCMKDPPSQLSDKKFVSRNLDSLSRL